MHELYLKFINKQYLFMEANSYIQILKVILIHVKYK